MLKATGREVEVRKDVAATETIAVVGAGTMGGGIAQVFATNGYRCLLYDVSAELRNKGFDVLGSRLMRQAEKGQLQEDAEEILSRVQLVSSLADLASVSLVVEAVVERLDVKRSIFGDLDGLCPPETILASNTSSLSVTEIAGSLLRPERVVGLHFFNPAPVLRLVELVRTRFNSQAVLERAQEFVRRIGKEAVVVADTPGFVVNRVARPYYNEALRIVGDGMATVEQVDRIMKAAGFPMGPFQLQDLIGIDVNYATTLSTYESFFQDPRFRPHPLQRSMVNAGTLGRKSGGGYYSYEPE